MGSQTSTIVPAPSIYSQYPQHISSEWQIDYSKPLGKGSFSDGVYKARKLDGKIHGKDIPNDGQCVVKIIGKKHSDKIGLKEIEIIDRLLKFEFEYGTCYTIIKYYGYGFSSDNGGLCFIYMEYLNGFKSLKQIIDSRDEKRLTDNEIMDISGNLMKGLSYLHSLNIIHRDIKCDNILYNQEINQVKLIDFGISKYTQTKASTIAGTPTHMSPEARLGKTTTLSDMWSLGCTLLEMAGCDLTNINNRNDNGAPIIPTHLNITLVYNIQSLLIKDPYLRLNSSFQQYSTKILRHKNINSILVMSYVIDLNNFKLGPDFNIPYLTKYIKISNFNQDDQSHRRLFSSIMFRLSMLNLLIDVLEIDNQPQLNILETISKVILSSFNEPITPDIVPPTVSILQLPVYNQPIEPNSISPALKSLIIPSFNHDLHVDSIPPTLQCLILGESFQFNDHGGNLPSTLKILSCAYHFKSSLKLNNNIPKSVCVLMLNNYNQPIDSKKVIPESVSCLVLGSNYTHFESLANLPSSVLDLTFEVDNLNDEVINQIQQYTPSSVLYLYVNNTQLR